MALDAVLTNLNAHFGALREALQALRLTVIEDRPAQDEVLLVERLGNSVEDHLGWTEEGLAAAAQARSAVQHPPDFNRARSALGVANLRFVQVEYGFIDDSISHRMIDELLRLGRRRGAEWLAWSTSVVPALEACRVPLRALDEALIEAWQELCDRLEAHSVSVTTTHIARQIVPPRRGRPSAGPYTAVDDFS